MNQFRSILESVKVLESEESSVIEIAKRAGEFFVQASPERLDPNFYEYSIDSRHGFDGDEEEAEALVKALSTGVWIYVQHGYDECDSEVYEKEIAKAMKDYPEFAMKMFAGVDPDSGKAKTIVGVLCYNKNLDQAVAELREYWSEYTLVPKWKKINVDSLGDEPRIEILK